MISENECTASHMQDEYQTISLPKFLYHVDTTIVSTHPAYGGTNGDQ